MDFLSNPDFIQSLGTLLHTHPELIPSRPAPIPFKPSKPEKYSGSPVALKTHLLSVREYLSLLDPGLVISEPNRVKVAASFLTDKALQWYQWHTVENGHIFSTFSEYEAALTLEFNVLNPTKKARDELAALKQTESVATYVSSFRAITLRIPDLSAAEKMDRFIRGLKDKTRLFVESHFPESIEKAMQLADQYDSVGSSVPTSFSASAAPTPMDLSALLAAFTSWNNQNRRPQGKLTPEIRRELQQAGLCFYCRGSGHVLRDCPKRRANGSNPLVRPLKE